ncbi:hypothetical protein EVAR_45448_1 [Eumeta japonica]|uniref:Uncharacterized protein n=1 Tax=Eumeta variegata TaxID=151549 RepID=A0A4C1YGP8_EUMVA|nr:hypothetical protein EVAR_45448_1 [Eumeta japonica]
MKVPVAYTPSLPHNRLPSAPYLLHQPIPSSIRHPIPTQENGNAQVEVLKSKAGRGAETRIGNGGQIECETGMAINNVAGSESEVVPKLELKAGILLESVTRTAEFCRSKCGCGIGLAPPRIAPNPHKYYSKFIVCGDRNIARAWPVTSGNYEPYRIKLPAPDLCLVRCYGEDGTGQWDCIQNQEQDRYLDFDGCDDNE